MPAGSGSLVRLRSLRQVTAYMTPDRSTRLPRCPSQFALSGQLPHSLAVAASSSRCEGLRELRRARPASRLRLRPTQAATTMPTTPATRRSPSRPTTRSGCLRARVARQALRRAPRRSRPLRGLGSVAASLRCRTYRWTSCGRCVRSSSPLNIHTDMHTNRYSDICTPRTSCMLLGRPNCTGACS